MAYKCTFCDQTVTESQEAIECDGCSEWNHRICNTGITKQAYNKAVWAGADLSWRCLACRGSEGAESSTILEQSMDKQVASELHNELTIYDAPAQSTTSATPAVNGSSQSGSVMQWGTVEVPPPGSYSHAPSSSQSSDHAASESTMPNPKDESDFMIDPIFLSDGEFSAPVTSESSPAVTKEDIWSLLSGTLFSETYHQSFELLQEQHKKQIEEEIKKAAHDTLPVIVKEFKGLLRKAVLEQLKDKHQMESVLEDQRKKFQEFLQEQDASEMKTLMEKEEVIFSGTYRPNFTNLDSTVESSDLTEVKKQVKSRRQRRRQKEKERKKKILIRRS